MRPLIHGEAIGRVAAYPTPCVVPCRDRKPRSVQILIVTCPDCLVRLDKLIEDSVIEVGDKGVLRWR